MVRLVRLTTVEAPRLRAIRLRALLDAPDAFGATYEDAAARCLDGWTSQLRELPTFVAVSDGHDVGMVRFAPGGRADTAWLISMWVAPEVRRMGVGGALVDAVIEHARGAGVVRLLLDVADHNEAAVALYERKGFVPNGEVGTLPPPREHIRERRLELPLVISR
ncbi:MAG TPA: GNAT family N-acetyltransferase [Vicinamibacterales bacterium]|jgi:GNAT superfamily N-acetyltransferase